MDAATLGTIFGGIAVVIAYLSWRRPLGRNKRRNSKKNKDIKLKLTSQFPVFGNDQLGEHQIGFEIRNLGSVRHKICSWWIEVPTGEKLVMMDPLHWDVRLPYWLESGDVITLHMPAIELRRLNEEKNIEFEKMFGYVELGDSSKVKSTNSVPLAK